MVAVNFDNILDPNVSLVAFYGDKPMALTALIQQLQANLTNRLGKDFMPYELAQVHGTIIGCEGVNTTQGVISKWYSDRRQETKYIDFLGLVNYLQHQLPPLTVRIGGYDRRTEYNFRSRDRHLYERSWQLQSATNQIIPVLIGWSWQGDGVSLECDRLRRQLQQFNLLHKYHATPNAIDNDFYLRLGTINRQLNPELAARIAAEMRDFLATQPPLLLPIDLSNLAFAQYQDLSLSPATTKIVSIVEITPQQLRQLYGC